MRLRQVGVWVVGLAVPATVGAVAVQASPACERFVREYVQRPVVNSVSRATAEAWARWRTLHPVWRPSAAAHRPKYRMTREEVTRRIAFACQAASEEPETAIFARQLDTPERIVALSDFAAATSADGPSFEAAAAKGAPGLMDAPWTPAYAGAEVELPGGAGSGGFAAGLAGGLPYPGGSAAGGVVGLLPEPVEPVSGASEPLPAPVPEPSSLLMVGLGLLAASLIPCVLEKRSLLRDL